MDRTIYINRMSIGIHRMCKKAQYEEMVKRAWEEGDQSQYSQWTSNAGDWLKNNWGKASGAALLSLLGLGLGWKTGGPLLGLLGLLGGGYGGYNAGNWLQNWLSPNGQQGEQQPQLTPEQQQQQWNQAYNDAFDKYRTRVDRPTARAEESWLKPWTWRNDERNQRDLRRWNRKQQKADMKAKELASGMATDMTGYNPYENQGVQTNGQQAAQ